jgi:hypothetical protein
LALNIRQGRKFDSTVAAVVEAEVQRPREDQDHRQHLHGGGGATARKRRRQSGQFLGSLRVVYIGDVKPENACDNAGNSDTYLLTLANGNGPICVASSKVAKASTICVAIAGIIAGVITLTFANVNTAYTRHTVRYFQAEIGLAQSCFNKIKHLLVCKQSKRGWEPQIFYSYFVMSQLYETEIP